jgi:GR25 family glycosyltransferase involved in LPS biosynthesis
MELLKNTLFINLEHRKDRLEHVCSELQKLGIEGERVNAVKSKIGAIGCTLSHIRCLELAKQRGYEYVFICEDDITFTNPELLLKNLTKFHEEDNMMWDMIIIGGNNVPPYQTINENCVRVFYCQTTTGYIIKNSYYDTLLKNFKESAGLLMKNPTVEGKKSYSLDIYWKRLQMQDFWFMITPPTVTQYENYSDIEERNTNYNHLMLDMEKEWYFAQFKNMR